MNSITKLLAPCFKPTETISDADKYAELASYLNIENSNELNEYNTYMSSKRAKTKSVMNKTERYISVDDEERKKCIIDYVNSTDPEFQKATENDYKKSLKSNKRKTSDLDVETDALHPTQLNTDEDSVCMDDPSVSSTTAPESNLIGVVVPLSFIRELLHADKNIMKRFYSYHVRIPIIGALAVKRYSKFEKYLSGRHKSKKAYKRCMHYLNIKYEYIGEYCSMEEAQKALKLIAKFILQYYREKYKYRVMHKQQWKKRRMPKNTDNIQ